MGGGEGGLTRSGNEWFDGYHVCENQMHKMFGMILELKTLETQDMDKALVFVLTSPNIYFRTKSNFQEFTKDFWYGLSHYFDQSRTICQL